MSRLNRVETAKLDHKLNITASLTRGDLLLGDDKVTEVTAEEPEDRNSESCFVKSVTLSHWAPNLVPASAGFTEDEHVT